MKIKKFLNNSKAISPIFATLILIAIAVIAGVVVYMFTSGTLATMTGGGTAAQEKVAVQAVQVTATGTGGVFTQGSTTNFISVYAQAQGSPVTISSIIVKNAGGDVVGPITLSTTSTPVTASTTQVLTTLTTMKIYPPTGSLTLASGSATYTVTLISTNGGSFVSPSFTIIGATA